MFKRFILVGKEEAGQKRDGENAQKSNRRAEELNHHLSYVISSRSQVLFSICRIGRTCFLFSKMEAMSRK